MQVSSRQDIQKIIIEQGFIPVFNHDDQETAFRVVRACYSAGLRVFEWTNRGPYAIQLFPELLKMVRNDCPGMLLGVGSVVDEATAMRFVAYGIDFLVSPILDPDLANLARKKKLLWIPGCGTATEIHQAQKWGAGLVKVFPGGSLGPGFVKAVLGPMPWSSIMPTGGVSPDEENLRAWFNAGVACVGMGSKLFTQELIEKEHENQLQNKIRDLSSLIRKIRNV